MNFLAALRFGCAGFEFFLTAEMKRAAGQQAAQKKKIQPARYFFHYLFTLIESESKKGIIHNRSS